MTSETNEKSMDDVMKKINSMKKSYTGKVLFGSSIATTVVTGVFGAMFYSDYNSYMDEKKSCAGGAERRCRSSESEHGDYLSCGDRCCLVRDRRLLCGQKVVPS